MEVSFIDSDIRFKLFNFKYYDLLKKYKIKNSSNLIDYFEKLVKNNKNVFWAKDDLQIDYLSKYYLYHINSVNLLKKLYRINIGEFDSVMYLNGDYYVVLINYWDLVYVIRFKDFKIYIFCLI